MKKILKLFTLLLAFVSIILIATAVFVPLLVDPNEYRQDIAQLVQERTGRSLKIDGDISISVFPWLGLDVGPVQLSNPEGFGASPFARIRSARLRVKLAPLLKRQVEMDTVSLDGLELNLIRNPGGHDNWADLVQSQSDEEPDGTDPGLAALAIGGVELTEARLIWDDRANGSRYTVDNLNLNTGPLELGRPFQVKTTLDLTSSTPDLQGHIELEGLTKVDPSTPSVQVSNARLTFSTDGDSLGIDQGTVEVTGNVNLNIAKQTVRIDQTAIGLSISSATHGVKSATANLTGTLSLDQPAQRARIEALRLETDVTTTAPEVHAHTVLSGLLTADMQTLVIALADMHLETSTDSAELGVKAAKGTVTGGLDLNLQDRTALFTKLNLVVDVSGDPAKLPVETARAKLAGDLILDLAGQTVKSDAIKLSADLNTAGPAMRIGSTVTGKLRADLATPAITLAKALVQADITGTDAGIQKMHGTMTGKLGLNLKQQTVTITGLKLVTDLQANKDQLGVSAVRGEVNGNVNYQLTKQLLTIGKLRVKADVDTGDAGIRAKGSLSARLTLDLTKPRLTARNLKVVATLTGDPLPEKKVPVKLAANLSTDLASQTFKATDISLDTFGLKIKGGLTGDKILDAPNLQGGVVVAPFNPRILLKKLGQTAPVTADRQALRLASLHGAFSLTPSSVTIPKLQLKIDDTRLTGSIDVTNIAKPAARFDLDVNSINLDRYLPPPGKKHPPSGTKPGDIKDGDSPIAVLGGMDLEGELRIGTLTLNKMHASKINLKLKGKDGVIRLEPLTATMYNGAITKHVTVDARGKTPKYRADGKLENIQIGPLLRDLQGQEKLTGTTSAGFNLTMEGVEGKRLMETLNGDLQLTVFNGALKGINIGAMIREARHKIQGKALPQDNRAQTDFTELSASAKITNGVLANKDLKAKSPLLRVSGEGTADLPNDRLNYLVNTSLVETSKGQGGKARSELRGITIPVRFTGSLSAPKYSLDPGQMLAAEAKRKVQKKLEKKVQDKLGDKLGDKLRGLFGR